MTEERFEWTLIDLEWADDEDPAPPSLEEQEKATRRHVDRAKHLIATKMGVGDQWDKARFVRELYEDAPGIDGFALAALLEQAISDSDGEPSEFRRRAAGI